MPFPVSIALSALDGEDGFRVAGLTSMDFAGRVVSQAGDINGDGIGDFVIGAPGVDGAFGDEGVAYVIFGRNTALGGAFLADFNPAALDGTNGFRVSTTASVERLGEAVGSAGDINGDGIDDLVIGAPYSDANPYDSGATYVIFGKANGFGADFNVADLDGTNGFRIVGQGGQRSGAVLSSGDFNGDGISDLLLGAGGTTTAYVVFGKDTATEGAFDATLSLTGLDGNNGFAMTGAPGDGGFVAASAAGDVNGDGTDDIVIGARNASPGGMGGAGAAYVLLGRSSFAASVDLTTLDGTDGFRINGVAAFDAAGWSVASAGDINGDGFDDVAIGAPQTAGGASYTGSVYIVFGQDTAGGGFAPALELSALNGTNGFRLDGTMGYDIAGWSVDKAGDVNGDGFDDLIVGVPGASTFYGAAYVLFGRNTAVDGAFAAAMSLSSINGANGFRIAGPSLGSFAGIAVSAAGDVNGDGVDDMLIGSRTPSNGNESGVAYIVFGISDRVNFTGGAGDDVRSGGALADTLSGMGGKDVLSGLAGDDVIDGGDGNDQLFGGDGGDTLEGDAGGDIMYGDGGDDELGGGTGADKLFGGDGADTLNGNDDNDRIEGGAGADSLYGGDGNDQLDGGSGLDTLEGGAGNDVFIVNDAGETLIELANGGYDIVRTSLDGFVLGTNFEALQLLGSDDIDGSGNGEANNLQGNAGGNTLDGGAGVDTINGNDGDDIIVGGVGNDLLRGGTGADMFRVAHAFGATLETDQVYDFSAAEGDILDLSGAFGGTISLVAGFTKAAGQMTLTFAGGVTTLKLDVTGDGKADYQMKINGDVTGESGDWLL